MSDLLAITNIADPSVYNSTLNDTSEKSNHTKLLRIKHLKKCNLKMKGKLSAVHFHDIHNFSLSHIYHKK